MFLVIASLLLGATGAFAPVSTAAFSRQVLLNALDGLDQSGNTWKPDSEKMGSTDTGDYFPEDYDPDAIEFTEGMKGSQAYLGNDRDGPALPGMENLGEDAVIMGGIELNPDIPEGMEFTPSAYPDGTFEMEVMSNSKGGDLAIEVKPFCMGYEDFYASFAPGSHSSLSVSPSAGRMDRRGGETTFFVINCAPDSKAGQFIGDLVINLPEDNSSLTYKINVKSI